MALMYQRVVNVISKPPEERTETEVETLLPWFGKKSDLFGSLKQDVMKDIVRNCEFSTRSRGNVIIKQGEKGDCFYIILHGKVSIYINQAISEEEDEARIAERSREADLEASAKKAELDRSKFGNFIGHIATGQSFGEIALISKECIRNASIIADETTDLLVVNRELYNRSLRAAQAAVFEEKNKFIAEFPIFRQWQPKYKRQLAMSLRKEVIFFDSSIVKQGEPVTALHFLLRGQAKIVVDPIHHHSQYPQLLPMEDLNNFDDEDTTDDRVVPSNNPRKKELTCNTDKTPVTSQGSSRRKECRRRSIEISLVGTNEIIGDAEFILDLHTHIQSVVSTQKCEVYALDMKNYERLVVKKNPKTVDLIRENAEMKLLSRVSRLSHDHQVPLLKTLLQKVEDMHKPQVSKRGTRSQSPTENFNDIVPHRGPLIDIFGPGTVFYRNKMREKARSKVINRANNFRGATVRFGLNVQQAAGGSRTHNANNAHNGNSQEYELRNHIQRSYTSFDDQGLDGYGQTFMTKHDENGDVYSDDALDDNPALRASFSDWASSDRALTVLEERIKAWHDIAQPNATKPMKVSVKKLRRVTIEEGKEVKPGKKIILRKRQQAQRTAVTDTGSDDELDTSQASDTEGDTDGVQDCENEVKINAQHVKPSPSKPRSKLLFQLRKNRQKRHYTKEEYEELKKVLRWRQRSMWMTSLH